MTFLEQAEDAVAEFTMLSIVHGGLMTAGQAARVIGVPPSQVEAWIARGKFTSFKILGARMIPQPEVAAFRFYRNIQKPRGGRGIKSPTAAQLVAAGWGDMIEIGAIT